MKTVTVKRLAVAVKLGLVIGAWLVIEHQQTDFGETYVHELQKLHSELSLEISDFTDDRSYVIFEVSVDDHPNAKTKQYLATLGADIHNVYCTQISALKHEANIKLFHVNVRAESNDTSNIILSHSLSKEGCGIQ
jgi:hypothetical protein